MADYTLCGALGHTALVGGTVNGSLVLLRGVIDDIPMRVKVSPHIDFELFYSVSPYLIRPRLLSEVYASGDTLMGVSGMSISDYSIIRVE